MKLAPGRSWARAAALLACAPLLLCRTALGQPFPVEGLAPDGVNEAALNDAVRVDEADSTVRSDLAQADELAAAGQFGAALERYRLARQAAGKRLTAVDDGRRFLPVGELVALRLAAWPAEGLALARQQFDPLARPLLTQGLAERDPALLERIVQEYFVASVADEALLALGDIALEQGRPAAARAYWQRIARPPNDPGDGFAAYPGPDVDLAGVAARRALASLFASDREQARRDIDALAAQFPTAMGTLGGRKGAYRALLEDLYTASAQWPAPAAPTGWPTFAGDDARNAAAPAPLEIGALAWDPIPLATDGAARPANSPLLPGRRQGEFAAAPCSTFPVWARLAGRDLLFFSDERSVFAVDSSTGQSAWSPDGAFGPVHTIPWKPAMGRRRLFGTPRHTLTVAGGLLLARLGAVGTYARGGQAGVSPSYLACLDLNAEGRLLWRAPAAEKQEAFHRDGWSFDGPPVCDAECAYVALRRTDIRAQAFVECYELATGQRRWQTFVCAADTPGQGMYEEAACNLLSLSEGRLFFNTNQGVVASLATADGRVVWASRYPRAAGAVANPPPTHFGRSPNPCVLHRGRLFVAPADATQVFAFEQSGGRLLWQSDDKRVDDVRYLMGARGNWLIASGDRLHWLDAESGRRERSFPDGPGRLGCGRGLIAAGRIYWPTRGDTDEIRVFDLQSGRQERVVDLSSDRGGQAGNLLAVGDRTVIAAHDALYCFSPQGQPPPKVDSRRTALAPTEDEPVAR
ncbi:MAG: PQQ-binding-like beta-propeller repeat protein [Pirellulales bacterium]